MKELEKSIQQYKLEQQNYEEKLKLNSEELKKLRAHLEDVDKKVQALRPSIKLDTLDNRCKWSFLEITLLCVSSLLYRATKAKNCEEQWLCVETRGEDFSLSILQSHTLLALLCP